MLLESHVHRRYTPPDAQGTGRWKLSAIRCHRYLQTIDANQAGSSKGDAMFTRLWRTNGSKQKENERGNCSGGNTEKNNTRATGHKCSFQGCYDEHVASPSTTNGTQSGAALVAEQSWSGTWGSRGEHQLSGFIRTNLRPSGRQEGDGAWYPD